VNFHPGLQKKILAFFTRTNNKFINKIENSLYIMFGDKPVEKIWFQTVYWLMIKSVHFFAKFVFEINHFKVLPPPFKNYGMIKYVTQTMVAINILEHFFHIKWNKFTIVLKLFLPNWFWKIKDIRITLFLS